MPKKSLKEMYQDFGKWLLVLIVLVLLVFVGMYIYSRNNQTPENTATSAVNAVETPIRN